MTYNISTYSQKVKSEKTDDARTNRNSYDDIFLYTNNETINKKQSNACTYNRQYYIDE